jgi:hypothetical protein
MDIHEGMGMDGNWNIGGQWNRNMGGSWNRNLNGAWNRAQLNGAWNRSMSGQGHMTGNWTRGMDGQWVPQTMGALAIKDLFSSLTSGLKTGLQTAQDKAITSAAQKVLGDPTVQAAAQRSGQQAALQTYTQQLSAGYDSAMAKLKASQSTITYLLVGGVGLFVAYKIYKGMTK